MRKHLLRSFVFILVLILAGSVSAGIDFDSVSSAGAGGVDLSWQHTIGNGADRILVVGIAAEDGSTSQLVIDSITYGAAEMTQVAGSELITGTYFLKTELYYLLAPPVGTDTITITYSGWITSISAGAVSFFNVAQQAREVAQTSEENSASSISTNITPLTEEALIIDVVGSGVAGSFTATGTGMTEQFNILTGSASGAGSAILNASAGLNTLSWSNTETGLMAHSVAVFAGIPQPEKASGANLANSSIDVPPYSALSWIPGLGADSHDVYFGNNFDDINDADNTLPANASVYKGNQPFDANIYDPCFLDSQQTYYWRIDEVINEDPLSPYKGSIWNFTVQQYLGGDFTGENSVDGNDLEIMAGQWLNTGVALDADADFNGRVDFGDYRILANNWLVAPVVVPDECENWQALHPEWIFCDDFEIDAPMVAQGRYFEHSDDGGEFIPMESVGLGDSKGMRVLFQAGEVSAGSLKLGFGRNPNGYMNRGIRPGEDFRDIYYRMYLKMQDGWIGSPAKLSRASCFVSASDWSQAMIAHLWSSGDYLLVDPVRCVNPATSLVMCQGYNDFGNMDWIGNLRGITPIFDSLQDDTWFCIEAHVKLNDPGLSNGVQEFWIDGQLEARRDGLNFVVSYTDYAINAIFFENYWNSGSSQEQERYFDNIVVSTEPIGCDCE